jgi:hypothetical protein
MLVLLTIFLFVFTPLAMLILRLVRPRFSIQGFLAVLAVLSALPMVFLAGSKIPQVVSLLQWQPVSLFPVSPALLIDDISWYFALALIVLAFSVVITSIAQLGQSTRLDILPTRNKSQTIESPYPVNERLSPAPSADNSESGSPTNWSFWAAVLILTSLGLLAVTAGNMLTLLLAWVALDIFELIVLLGHVFQSKNRERVILVFFAKLIGTITLLIAALVLWSHGDSLSFEAISLATSVYLVLASGIRLGVLPLQLPFTQGLPMQRGLGTALRLIPAASSYILLVRVSNMGVAGAITPYLLALTALAGLYAAVNWIRAKDELSGRPLWMLGTASLAVAAAILNHPSACLAWCIASLLSGGFIFSISIRHRNLFPLIFLGIFNLSCLPFSPTWQGTSLYGYSSSSRVSLMLFSVYSFMFLLIQSFLLAGFIRHSLRGIYPAEEKSSGHIEQWAWLLYPIGLILPVVIHLFIGWRMYPNLNELPVYEWIVGPISLIIAGIVLYIIWRYPQLSPLIILSTKNSTWENLFSLEWLYRLLWKLFRSISKVFALFSAILEGEAGILWALALFALIFVFLQR